MKAARLHNYDPKLNENLKIEEVDEPKIEGPLDVIVRIGGAGLCRTDIHIMEGQWKELSGVTLPYTLGHENAGWVRRWAPPSPTSRSGTPLSCTRSSPVVCAGRAGLTMICTVWLAYSPASTQTAASPTC